MANQIEGQQIYLVQAEAVEGAAQALKTQAEVQQASEGLPQLNVIKDGTYTNQIIWLFVSFIILYVLISKFALPRIGNVLDERDSRIRSDLDKAEECRAEAEKVKSAYEASLADASSAAKKQIVKAKEEIQAEINKVSAELDSELSEKIDAAEADIAKAKDAAMKELATVAQEITADIVAKFGHGTVDSADVEHAVKAASEEA